MFASLSELTQRSISGDDAFRHGVAAVIPGRREAADPESILTNREVPKIADRSP
jgi:hypothetical protein